MSSTTAWYRVKYLHDGLYDRTLVSISEGFSTFEDIRKILAVSNYSSNRPDDVDRIKVLSVELADDPDTEPWPHTAPGPVQRKTVSPEVSELSEHLGRMAF